MTTCQRCLALRRRSKAEFQLIQKRFCFHRVQHFPYRVDVLEDDGISRVTLVRMHVKNDIDGARSLKAKSSTCQDA